MVIMDKPVILTGIRANNDIHLGNYLGGLLPIVDMAKRHADDYQINLFIPDLHSFTTPIDHTQLQNGIMQALRIFLAAGLPIEHENVYMYRQSYIPAHSELTWILDCFTGMGEMMRMTQYKDKAAKLSEDRIGVGLFNYPVLMAADILLYGATYVPVGEDQTQHIEFTRDIAMRMNNQFGELFTVPKSIPEQHKFFGNEQGLRIKDLTDPAKKMSKSGENDKGILFMADSPETARKKIMAATTDSLGHIRYDKQAQPGVANLLEIVALLGDEPLEDVVNRYNGQTQYGPLKDAAADLLSAFMTDFQSRLATVDDQAILNKLASSEKAMAARADQVLYNVQKAVGLRS